MRPSSSSSSEKRPSADQTSGENIGNGGGNSSSTNAGGKFKGVRMRKWGKWVAEVRLPNSRDRIWLGSYDSRDKAARAYDAAVFCLRGPGATFNFPDNPPHIPDAANLTPPQIQAVAARFAHEEDSAPAPAPARENVTEETGGWPAAASSVSGMVPLEMGYFASEYGASPLGCYFTGTEVEEEDEDPSCDGDALYQQQSGLWNF